MIGAGEEGAGEGAAYVYNRDASRAWRKLQKIQADDKAYDRFGSSPNKHLSRWDSTGSVYLFSHAIKKDVGEDCDEDNGCLSNSCGRTGKLLDTTAIIFEKKCCAPVRILAII